MRQLLPPVPKHSVLPSWFNIRPSIMIDSSLYSDKQMSISPQKHTQLSAFALTTTKVHKILLLQSQNFHIHEREHEKRKHLHKTASTELQRFFFFFSYNAIVEQASSNESSTNFLWSERFPESKKQRRKGAISPGLFLTESLPSLL